MEDMDTDMDEAMDCRTWIAGQRLQNTDCKTQIAKHGHGHGLQDMDTDMDRRTGIAGHGYGNE